MHRLVHSTDRRPPGAARTGVVLVADGDRSMRRLLRTWIERRADLPRPVRVICVGDGPTAWALLRSNDIDVLLASDDLPGIRGAELIRRTKRSARGPRVACVLASFEALERLTSGNVAPEADHLLSYADQNHHHLDAILRVSMPCVTGQTAPALPPFPADAHRYRLPWGLTWNPSPL